MKIKRWVILFCLLLLLALSVAPVLAETTTIYDLSWWTVDNGGTIGLTSGSYTLSGTAGQPDTGTLSAGDYDLTGGFWAVLAAHLQNYLPLIKK